MNEKSQNATLMTTSIDEETGKTMLIYIPLNVDISVVNFFLKNGTCTNNQAVEFELKVTGDEFWTEMWKDLTGEENAEH